MDSRHPKLLEVHELCTGYGKKQVVNNVSLDAARGEIVALIGHNGAGKSTLLKAVFALLPVWKGTILMDGCPLKQADPRSMLRAGMAYVPQGNRVFPDLTVRENLRMGEVMLRKECKLNERVESVLRLFPALKERLRQRAATLSGGEKQMLALAMALVLSPRLLLLDEPSLGLAPPLISKAFGRLQQIARQDGITLLIVEQKVREILTIADRVYVLRNGRVSFTGKSEELSDETILKRVFL